MHKLVIYYSGMPLGQVEYRLREQKYKCKSVFPSGHGVNYNVIMRNERFKPYTIITHIHL